MAESKSLWKNILGNIFSRGDTLREDLKDFFEDRELSMSGDQLQMIMAVVRLLGLDAEMIKVPASRMVTIPLNATLKDCVAVIQKSGHSRIPVYEEKETHKEYVGILYAKDLIPNLARKEGRFRLAKYMRKHYVVPESQGLLSLLRDMRLKKHHLALTVSEHGEITGLITLEDILEEIVGEIHDEYDPERTPIKEIGLRTYKVDATIPLSDINKQLATNLPEEKFNTLAGFMLHELKGELKKQAVANYEEIEMTLERFSGQSIKSVIIRIPASSGPK